MEIRKPQNIFLFPLLLLFLLSFPRMGFPAERGGETISSVKYLCAVPLYEKDLEDLTGIRSGARFSPRSLDRAIKLLYLTRRFYRVTAEINPGPTGLEVEFYLVPRRIIGEIKIKGLRSVKSGEIQKVWDQEGIRSGLEFSERTISRVKKLLENYFRSAGFPLAEVEIQGRFAPGDPGVTMTVEVNEGPSVRIQAVDFSGDPYLPPERIRRELRLKNGDRLDLRLLRERIKVLEQWYRRQGLWEIKIGEPEIRPGPIPLLAAVRIPIQAGRRIRVDFSGPDIPEEEMRDLIRITQLPEDEEFSLAWIEEKAKEIKDIYRQRGKVFIEVKTVPEEPSRRELVYHFSVDKGPTIYVRRIEFSGNLKVSSDSLQKQMLTNTRDLLGHIYKNYNGIFLEEVLDEDLKAILFLYHKLGYASARITGVDQEVKRPATKAENGDLVLKIGVEEGVRTRVGEVVFTGNQALSNEEIGRLVTIRIGECLDPARVEEGRKKIMEWYARNGFPLARAETRVDFSADRSQASVSYLIEEGLLVRLDRIIVSGTRWTRDYVIQREFYLKPGDTYDFEKVGEGRRRLFNLGFLREVQAEPSLRDPSHEDWDLLVHVREDKGGFFELGGGYATEEGLRAFAGVQHQNLWGTGRGALARGEVKFGLIKWPQDLVHSSLYQLTHWKFDAGYREPWVFHRNLLGRLDLNTEYIQRGTESDYPYDYRSSSGSVGVEREFGKNIKGTLKYQVERVERNNYLADYNGIKYPALDWDEKISPIILWDNRDDIFYPSRGLIITSNLDLSHSFLDWDRSYVKAFGEGGIFHKLVGRLIGALVLRLGYAYVFGRNEDIPIDKKFQLGGVNSVRGFLKNTIGPQTGSPGTHTGGNIQINYQGEIRFPFPGSQRFGAVVFTDGGGLWNKSEEVKMNGIRKTTGVGLRYYTPIGPILLDWGFKLDRRTGEALSEYYLAIGNPF
ncbi:MAG: outer membrane protein assembly factor BamA [Proteobacteria bacterium]|nr:outer membrane protein assembly factor BamA [Pseudomonadota bacterium]